MPAKNLFINLLVLAYFIHMGRSEDFVNGYITSTVGMVTLFIYHRITHEAH